MALTNSRPAYNLKSNIVIHYLLVGEYNISYNASLHRGTGEKEKKPKVFIDIRRKTFDFLLYNVWWCAFLP